MERRNFIKAMAVSGVATVVGTDSISATEKKRVSKESKGKNETDRAYWTDLLYKMAAPVLSSMAKGELRKQMKVEVSPSWDGRTVEVTYLECFGRLMLGLAPWLTLPDDDTEEGKQRKQLREWALESLVHSVDPKSPDYLLWRQEGQPLVDSAFYSNALIRAPKQLWDPLDAVTKKRIIEELKQMRRVRPSYSNWLLFAAMNEAFFLLIGEEYDPMRIDLSLRKMDEWYVGDGWYSDGERFHFDYYNSYVIQPMLVEILEVMEPKGKTRTGQYELALKRMQRYGDILERLVSPEGTFPTFGRSLTYRTAAFQPLSLLAWKKQLSSMLTEGQVRAALTAVHKSIFSDPSNFNSEGFLTIGFAGHQPDMSDSYSNNGSMYLTSASFLPLGLPASDSFWTSPAADWTAKKAFSNHSFAKDHAISE